MKDLLGGVPGGCRCKDGALYLSGMAGRRLKGRLPLLWKEFTRVTENELLRGPLHRPFQYPIEGYAPLEAPPPQQQLRAASYLCACLLRLVEVSSEPRATSTAAAAAAAGAAGGAGAAGAIAAPATGSARPSLERPAGGDAAAAAGAAAGEDKGQQAQQQQQEQQQGQLLEQQDESGGGVRRGRPGEGPPGFGAGVRPARPLFPWALPQPLGGSEDLLLLHGQEADSLSGGGLEGQAKKEAAGGVATTGAAAAGGGSGGAGMMRRGRPAVGSDEAVLLASLVAEHLGPLCSSQYVVCAAVLPMLLSALEAGR